MMAVKEQDVAVDEKLRKLIINEINGPENQKRKDESYRRHTCYKDRTKEYVLQELLKQFDDTTVREMGYSISNISIGRKIIDKLARVYTQGVLRTGSSEAETESIEQISKLLDLNKSMKRANRYLRMHHNTLVGVLPCPKYDLDELSYEIKIQVFQPHLYDVIEDPYNRESIQWVILSNYKNILREVAPADPAKAGRGALMAEPKKVSDGVDQAIADKKEDQNANKEEYIWWSKHYHFTTNANGEIISNGLEQDNSNPIVASPFINFSMDQEGSFWAEGGDDIFDGSVHVNCMITNVQHIGVTQGYGQFYMKGKNLPRFVKAGVNKSIIMEYEEGDPVPDIGFASSNPKLQELKDQVVMYVALLLTTNNLSTKAVAAELNSSQDFASGISLIIDKSESVEDVQDQRDIFYQNEPKIFDLVQRWQEVYKEKLTEDFKKYQLPENLELKIKFNDVRPIMSEKEKLENLKLRKDLGITSMIKMLMIDNQDLTEKQAEEELLKLLEQQIKESSLKLKSEPEEENDNLEQDQVDDEEIDNNEDENQEEDKQEEEIKEETEQ